jgi:hypothetical protein
MDAAPGGRAHRRPPMIRADDQRAEDAATLRRLEVRCAVPEGRTRAMSATTLAHQCRRPTGHVRDATCRGSVLRNLHVVRDNRRLHGRRTVVGSSVTRCSGHDGRGGGDRITAGTSLVGGLSETRQ